MSEQLPLDLDRRLLVRVGPFEFRRLDDGSWWVDEEGHILGNYVRALLDEIVWLRAEWEESRELLAEARAEVERLREALSPDALADAMQSAWNDWCADTGCIPDAFSIRGPRTTQVYADFRGSNYAHHVAARAVLAENEEQAIARAALARIGSVSRETLDSIPTQVLDSPDDEPSNRTRTVDHGTSAAGARAVSFRSGTQKHRLLIAYAETSGLTDEEAAAAARLPSSACWWKRCSELRDVGAIEPTGETRVGAAGVPRIVCSITEQGWNLLWDSDPVVVS